MIQTKKSTSKKSAASSKKSAASSKKSPSESKSIDVVLKLINERYKSNKDEPIDAKLKEEVKKIIKKHKFLTYLDSNEIIHTDKFIEIICILLPKPMNGGDNTLTKYEKESYFSYHKKYLIYDIVAFASLIYAFILIYIAYQHFYNFYSDTDKIFDYNKILEGKHEDLQIDNSSVSAFFKYTYHLIQNSLCSSKENIFKYIQHEIINLKDTTIKDVNADCFINHENSYFDFILKGIQLWTSPTRVNTCVTETAYYNLQQEINKKIHHLKLSNISINDIYTYSFEGLKYGGFAILYLKARLGIAYCYAPRISKTNTKKTLLLENNSKGGTRKRKNKNTRRNYVM